MSFLLITMRILYVFLGSLSELFDCSFLTCRRLEFNFNCLLGIYWQYRRVLHSSADMFTIVPSRAKKFLTSSHGICEANSELFVLKFDFLAMYTFSLTSFVSVDTGTKVNGGFFLWHCFYVNVSNCSS